MPIDMNRKYQTRDGRRARILCTDRKSSSYPVAVLVTLASGEEALLSFNGNGRYEEKENPLDLVPAPEKRWAVVGYSLTGRHGTVVMADENAAQSIANSWAKDYQAVNVFPFEVKDA